MKLMPSLWKEKSLNTILSLTRNGGRQRNTGPGNLEVRLTEMRISPLTQQIVSVLMLLIAASAGCKKTDLQQPRSAAELAKEGFYIFHLPASEIANRRWSETFHIASFDRHCRGIGEIETANPIEVIYRNNESENVFSFTLGPWNMAWDHREPTIQVKIETEWAKDSIAEYYEVGEGVKSRFIDKFGIDVQVYSSFPISETVALVNRIEYLGPPPETVTDPWDVSKCK
jgi:hypothetical protein